MKTLKMTLVLAVLTVLLAGCGGKCCSNKKQKKANSRPTQQQAQAQRQSQAQQQPTRQPQVPQQHRSLQLQGVKPELQPVIKDAATAVGDIGWKTQRS